MNKQPKSLTITQKSLEILAILLLIVSRLPTNSTCSHNPAPLPEQTIIIITTK